jgi:hypothetical protein
LKSTVPRTANVASQGEPRLDAQRVERAARAEGPRRVALERQRRRELGDLGQRDRPSHHVDVHRLPAGGVHGDAADGARAVRAVLMHDVHRRDDELAVARAVERRRARQRAADRQRGEEQLGDVDLERRHPHAQVARAHDDRRAREAEHAVGDHAARPAVVRRERDVRVEVEALERAIELRAAGEHALARRPDRRRDLLEELRRHAGEAEVRVVERDRVAHRDAEVALDVRAAGAQVAAPHHVVLRRAAPLDEHRGGAAAVLGHVRVQPAEVVERGGLAGGGEPHVPVVDHVHAVAAHSRGGHLHARALPPQ